MPNNSNRGRFSVDLQGDYLQYMPEIPTEWEAIGTVSRNQGKETGALLKNKHTGIYAMGNHRLIQNIPQHKITAILNHLSNPENQEMKEKTKEHRNSHRMNKKAIQFCITLEENELVNHIREKRNFLSYRDTLIHLCKEEDNRIKNNEKEIPRENK